MRRRRFIALVSGAAVAWSSGVQGQKSAMPVIGVLSAGSPAEWRVAALRQGLADAGYVDGKNVMVEFHWAEGHFDRLSALAADLVSLRIVPPPKVNVDALEQGFRDLGYAPGRDILIEYRYADGRDDELRRLAADVVARKVDIILAAGYEAIRAAKIATGTTPIVMVVAGDPVGSGFVTSLARPGGNITGNSIINPTLAPKRLEVFKQVLPTLSRVATLLNKSNPSHQVEWKATLAAAKALAIVVQPYEVRGPMDFEPAFAAMIGARAEAVVVLEDAVFGTEGERRLFSSGPDSDHHCASLI